VPGSHYTPHSQALVVLVSPFHLPAIHAIVAISLGSAGWSLPPPLLLLLLVEVAVAA